MLGEDGTDELKAVGGDAFGDSSGNRNGSINDESLDLASDWTGTLHDQSEGGAGGAFDATFEEDFAWIRNFFET